MAQSSSLSVALRGAALRFVLALAVLGSPWFTEWSQAAEASDSAPLAAGTVLRPVPGLEEPLIATGPVSKPEYAALDAAIGAFRNPAAPRNDFAGSAEPFVVFLEAYPTSSWRLAVPEPSTQVWISIRSRKSPGSTRTGIEYFKSTTG
jgi:hypothetical protein